MILLFHGDDDFEKSQAIAVLKPGVSADPSLIPLNVTELAGRSVTSQTLQHHCDVPPFLGEYRLVIVSDLAGRGSGGEVMAWLIEHLPSIPDSTRLVLNESKRLPASHALVKAVSRLQEGGEVRVFNTPRVRGGELARWVGQRAAAKGARLAGSVAADLANFIGPDLRLIDSELEKLSIYAGDRPITPQDVRLLVPYAQSASIFDMVDALGHRRTPQAFRLLSQLRSEGAHPLYLLTMIVRQYRILCR